MVFRAQIFKKNAQLLFLFHAQAKMLSFKVMLRLKCSDESKWYDDNKYSDKNAQLKKMLRWKLPVKK